MAFAFVFLIVAGQFGDTTGQNCGFPSSWKGDYYWWSAFSGTSSSGRVTRTFKKYETSSESNFEHYITPEGQIGEFVSRGELTCRGESVINERHRYYLRDARDDRWLQCISIHVEKENKMLVEHSHTVPHETVVMSCTTQRYTLYPKVFIKYPFVFDAACPFAYDLYSITVRRADAQPMCGSGRSTISIDKEKSQLTISACLSQNSFKQPFHGATLRCVGDLEPEDISSTSENGKVYIFGYASASDIPDIHVTHFYVARYMEGANGTVFMSLQGRTDDTLLADKSSDYRYVEGLDNGRARSFAYAFVMNPISCEDALCENGATCDDADKAFMCVCPVDFTGVFCETSTITTVASVTTRPNSSTAAIARSTTSSPLSTTTSSIARSTTSTTSSPLSATTLDINKKAGPQAQSGGSSDATPTIIGVVVAVLVVIIILAVVAYVIRSKRKKMQGNDREANSFVAEAMNEET